MTPHTRRNRMNWLKGTRAAVLLAGMYMIAPLALATPGFDPGAEAVLSGALLRSPGTWTEIRLQPGQDLLIGEDSQGDLVVRAVDPALDGFGFCTAFAPLDTDCSSGSYGSGWWLYHGVFVDSDLLCGTLNCYVGDIQSVLSGAGGERRFVCAVVAADLTILLDCVGSGSWPYTGFRHNCHARAIYTVDTVNDGSGVSPGSYGNFGCYAHSA